MEFVNEIDLLQDYLIQKDKKILVITGYNHLIGCAFFYNPLLQRKKVYYSMPRQQESYRKRLTGFTLRKKLILSFTLLLLIPSITIGLFSYQNAKQKLDEKIQTSAKENVEIIDHFLTKLIQPKMEDAAYFAKEYTQSSFSGDNLNDTIKSLQQYKGVNSEVVSVYIASEQGDLIIRPQAELPPGFDARTRPWYLQAKAAKGKTIITEPYVDKVSGSVLVTIAKQFNDGSGVVGIDLSLNALKEVTGDIKIGRNGYPFIVSGKGYYLVHPAEKIGTKGTGSWVTPLLEKDSGTLSYSLNGQDKKMDFATNKLTGYKIAGTMSLNEVNQDSNPILKTTFLIIGLFIVVGALLSYFIIRSITRPLNELVTATERVSDGDLTQKFIVKNNDEVSRLGESFNSMIHALHALIRHVDEQAGQLAASSEQLMASSEQNNLATEQIANSIQEVAAGTDRQTAMMGEGHRIVSDMSSEMEEILQHANVVANESLEAAGIVTNGNQAIQLSTSQMDNIHHTVNSLGTVIQTLGERSKEINQIIDVISDIASQTNLLALNAAIEAARAGEHGKGFAVVADEVRKLAEQSSKSTENIKALISSIQSDTSQAVTSMDKGKKEVAKGLDLVKSAGDAFLQMDQFVARVTDEFQQVTASIKEAAAGAEHVVEIVKNIEEINSQTTSGTQDVSAATEEQMASMEEIAASASTLAKMAEELQDSVKKFTI